MQRKIKNNVISENLSEDLTDNKKNYLFEEKDKFKDDNEYSYALEYSADKLKDDKEIVLIVVKQYGRALQYASDRLRDDKDVVTAAVKQNTEALEYASDRLKNDVEFLKILEKELKEVTTNKLLKKNKI